MLFFSVVSTNCAEAVRYGPKIGPSFKKLKGKVLRYIIIYLYSDKFWLTYKKPSSGEIKSTKQMLSCKLQ